MNYKNLKWYVSNRLSEFASIYHLLVSILLRNDGEIEKNSSIVIEGFPRSANTFSYWAFRFSQENFEEMHVAHHRHKISQIILGVKRGLPVIVLIRNPEDAIASLKIRHPEFTYRTMLKVYIFYYSKVIELKNNVIIADFDQVINNYSSILEQVNRKFGTNFSMFEATPENLKKIKETISQLDDVTRDPTKFSSRVALPNDERKGYKEQILKEINSNSALLKKAKDIYHNLTNQLP
ncbi:hypothetical protein SAMN05421640_0654 [Ekhidna lutea]|uniref:Sulfotransferase domain-containing protein n=1 Tax=Ekhidna lutea TaxID=447679 RepID=A0A239FG72_EKHLU|nr:hypothetical protein [Ekhidna lutea]SNS55797.1 hypothetical protein SAMN05421640_0654 [Ekhidna lutea]